METTRHCTQCGRAITLAPDRAWVDSSGACGCGDGEHTPRRVVTESEFERMLDTMVWRRLETDRAYQNAENAEEQAAREAEIETACERELRNKCETE